VYTGELEKKLTEIALKASKNVLPFRMGIGKGYCNMNINRRAEYAEGEIWIGANPDGPCDHELDVVKFESMENKTLAVLINWPCHGTVTGYSNYQISGDWPGAAARYIKKQIGEDIVVAVTAGASADINSVYRPSDSFRRVEAVGYHVGRETNNVFTQIETLPVKSLQATETTLYFPGKKRCEDHFPKTSFQPGPDKEIRLSVTKIGNLVFAGISGELMTEIGMEIKEQSPYSGTIVLTHCNGSSGYICTDKSYPEGGYEVQVTELMPGVERPLIREFAGLIHSFE
jgi:neutral ceramidase